jgi:hypothetical protein
MTPNAIDASQVDADPPEPDADPNQPDAQILADADPNAPDASGCDQGPTLGFSDDFDDNTPDPRWTVSTGGTGTAVEVNGRVEIGFSGGPPNHSGKFQTGDPTFDIAGSRVFVEVLQVVDADGISRFRIISTSSNFAEIRVNGSGQLQARVNNGPGVETLNTIVYNATQQRWWQMREAGSQLIFEVSPDGMSWSIVATTPTPSFAGDVTVELEAISTASNGSSSDAYFDNLNVLPACP